MKKIRHLFDEKTLYSEWGITPHSGDNANDRPANLFGGKMQK